MIDISKYGDRLVVGVSGGKDSTATCLHLMEHGMTSECYERVFIDTGWEHPTTYAHLDELEKTIGKITRIKSSISIPEKHKAFTQEIESRLGFESPFIRYMMKWGTFPAGNRKWCTRYLKLKPLKKWFESLEFEPVNVTGVRWQESKKRAQLKEIEWFDYLDCYAWRPIIDYKETDVIEIHKRFGISPNPLYLSGSLRVGCFPCILSRKKELLNLDETRIQIIRDLEKYVTANWPTEKESGHTLFQNGNIDDIVEWSKTSRGGKQFELFDLREPTCKKWGMCGV